jgi:tripartite-type tricarboxylate transporter receptor subunit TctC
MIRWLSVLVTMLCAAFPAGAQTYPSKIIRVIVPFAAGSTTDIVPRLIFEKLGPQLGQTLVVENRAGAGGTIGSAAVARSDADGYTLLVNSNAHTIAPAFYPGLSYHPSRDFAAVVPLGISPNVLVVSPSRGFKTIADLVAAAKAKPGSLNFSSVGVGSATHLSPNASGSVPGSTWCMCRSRAGRKR